MRLLRWLVLLTVCLLGSLDVSASCIVLTWTATGDDHRLGRASQYDIRYSTTPITEANWDEATKVTNAPRPKTAGSVEAVRVPNLVPGQTYYFALKVADERPNWSTLSNVVTRTTGEDCVGMVGNVDCDPDEQVSLSDLVMLVDYLFISCEPPCCPGEADMDGDPQTPVSLGDLVLLINYLFISPGSDLPFCAQ